MTPKKSRGWKKLRRLFPKRGGQAVVAAGLGVDPGTVSRWFSGERKPDPEQRARLQKLYSIDWQSWDKPLEDEHEPAEGAA